MTDDHTRPEQDRLIERATYAHDTYVTHAQQVATDLRTLADRVERAALDVHSAAFGPVRGPHVYAAEQALHELTWGLANVGAHRLVSDADYADRCDAAAGITRGA